MTLRSTAWGTIVALELLDVTGPNSQVINVNPSQIVDLRAPRSAEHFAVGANCLVFTADGKYLAVVQTCAVIKGQLKALQ